MSEAQMHDTLRRLFDVIVQEAERNPALAQKLAEIIAEPLGAQAELAKRGRRKDFDASQFHAVNILRLHGEPALRGKLEQVRALEDLRAIARASGLVLTGSAAMARANSGATDRRRD